MKKFILFFAFTLAISANVFAGTNNRDLMKRIQNQLGFTASEKAELGKGVAVVTFTIDANGLIQIVQCDATTETQKQVIMNRLNKFYVQNAPVDTDAIYSLRIDFTQR